MTSTDGWRKRACGVAMLLLAACVAGCGSTSYEITSQAADGARFAEYRTYCWPPGKQPEPTFDPSRTLPANAAIVQAVERELNSRGMRAAPVGEADLIVDYQVTTGLRYDREQWAAAHPNDPSDPAARINQRVAALDIELTEARTMRAVWRGRAQATSDNPAEVSRRIGEMVARILARYPR